MRRKPFLAAMTGLALALSGAAQAQTAATAASAHDPWEGFNRRVYAFNRALDRAVLRPVAVFYHHLTPRPLRNGLHNALTNCTGPIIFVNDVLQLRPKKAAVTATRFVVNSTVGIAGFNDVAANGLGLAYHDADFGQTLGRYGVRSGPYLFLPVFGPSTVRDLFGRVVDGVADPLNSVRYDGRAELGVARVVGGGLDARDRADPILKDIDRTATDPYAFIRSAYLQSRASDVRGETSQQSVQALPDFGPEPSPAPAGSSPSTPSPLPATSAGGQTAPPAR